MKRSLLIGKWVYYPLLIVTFLLNGCYSVQWIDSNTSTNYTSPVEVLEYFDKYDFNTLTLAVYSPGYDYKYDIGEKDENYDLDDGSLSFNKVTISLLSHMPPGQVLVNVNFYDEQENVLNIPSVDLLKLVPTLDRTDSLVFIEYLLEEFNRFGVQFRKEHQEFSIYHNSNQLNTSEYRCKLTNNCLEPGKFELELTSSDFTDFNDRVKNGININQNRILSHGWFYFDQELYQILIRLKNPSLKHDVFQPDKQLVSIGENQVIDFDKIRLPIKSKAKTKVLEIGHKTERLIEPLDVEQHFKKAFGLLKSDASFTYASILKEEIQTSTFCGRGHYIDSSLKTFNWSWLQYLDDVEVNMIDVEGTETYAELTLTGKYAPYNITIGNIDLALINEQKLWGQLFGFNTYPKTRRYNPKQATLQFDADLLPEAQKPYLLLTDAKTNKWVNNIYKGIEKVYLSYESIEKDVLEVYVLSYERITPVWMARVKFPSALRERIRVKQSLYNY